MKIDETAKKQLGDIIRSGLSFSSRGRMIYTIGLEKSYSEYFSNPKFWGDGHDVPLKERGGTVWRDAASASVRCPYGYKVYGVEASWYSDTEEVKPTSWIGKISDRLCTILVSKNPFRPKQLTKDAPLVDLDNYGITPIYKPKSKPSDRNLLLGYNYPHK